MTKLGLMLTYKILFIQNGTLFFKLMEKRYFKISRVHNFTWLIFIYFKTFSQMYVLLKRFSEVVKQTKRKTKLGRIISLNFARFRKSYSNTKWGSWCYLLNGHPLNVTFM